MRIEDLGVSEKCLIELKRVGFTLVEEIVEFLEEHCKDHMIRTYANCIWIAGERN